MRPQTRGGPGQPLAGEGGSCADQHAEKKGRQTEIEGVPVRHRSAVAIVPKEDAKAQTRAVLEGKPV